MGTINFSVPDDIRDEFNRCFAAQNKSAVLVQYIERAIAEQRWRACRLEYHRLRSGQEMVAVDENNRHEG